MDSQLLEGDIMEEGQEEWLSEGVLTDDDYNASQQSQQTNPESGSNLADSQDETMASASADDSQMETQAKDTDQQIIIQQFDSSLTDNQHIIFQQDDNGSENDKHFVIDGQHIVFQGLNNQPFIIQQPDGSQQIVLQQFDNQDIDGDQQIVLHQVDDQQDGQQLVFQQFDQTDQQIDNQQENNHQLVFEQFVNQPTDSDQQIENQQEGSQHLDNQQDGNQQIVLQQMDNQQFMLQVDSQQNENVKVESNIEETLNNFENDQNDSQTEQPRDDLPGELSTFLTRKIKPEQAETHEDGSNGGDDDGNDTDDLLRVLGDGDQKGKTKVTKEKHGADSTDDDDDSYIFEHKNKNYEATKNVIRRANASKALPDDDLTDCSSDDESKIVFTRVTRKSSPNRLSSTPQISTNVKPGTLTITPPNVQKKIVKKVINVVHMPETIRNVGKTSITSVSNTSKTSVNVINTSVSSVPKTYLNTSVSKTLNTSVSSMPTKSVSSMPTKSVNKTLITSIKSNQSASKVINTSVTSVSKTSPSKITFTKVRNMPTTSESKLINKSVSTPTTSVTKILNTSVSSTPKSVSNVPKPRVSVSNVSKTSVKVLNSSVDSMSKLNVSDIVSQVVKRSLVSVSETEQNPPAKQYPYKRLSTQAGSLLTDNPTKMVVVKKESKPTPVKMEQDNENDEFDMNEKSSSDAKFDQLLMKPEAMDEEMPSDMDSESEDDAMYDELPSSESDEQSDWFTYDIRAERAGDYLPLLGETAYQLLLEEKQRVTESLANLKKSLKVLTNASREQAEKIQQASQTGAELDAMIKST